MLGKIKLAENVGLVEMPQEAASAWSALESMPIMGASYKALLYVGEQQAKGVNYWFIVEKTLTYKKPERSLCQLAINYYDGEYQVIPHSLQELDFQL